VSCRHQRRFRLSYADVAEWLAERGVMVDRSTIYRWVQRFLPLFAEAARSHLWPVGGKWRVDETYCRLNGRWAYCYRAIDRYCGAWPRPCSESPQWILYAHRFGPKSLAAPDRMAGLGEANLALVDTAPL
jgi:hypothetical protein